MLLVPWLRVLDAARSARGAIVAALAMAVGFVAPVLGWFAPAIADYTGLPSVAAFALLLAAAPLLQPQFIAYALVRHAARRQPPALRAALAIAAWLASEWLLPRLFGDTLGHGLQPSRLLRQGADIAGAGGLTLLILIVNEAVAFAVEHRRSRTAVLRSLALMAAVPLLLAAYGAARLASLRSVDAGPPLRIALVQAAITDYERLRRERGAYAVVREVLDTHYAMSDDARRRGAGALVWPETVYPTTFGRPKSAAGADLDRELLGYVQRSGVPLVLGTYDRDVDGEYNAAAFVDPQRGALGSYHKTRLFPLTEYVPPVIDGAPLRSVLPWAGTWRPGDGARVFPLMLADGREVPVVPLICRDDLDPRLARNGARLGAELIVGLSNDAWFTHAPLGARLHLAAASFRSIETRLPQVRATTNGLSAVIDPTGEVVAHTRMGERTVLLADVRPRPAAATSFMRWGDVLGPASTLGLLAFGALSLQNRRAGRLRVSDTPVSERVAPHFDVLLLRSWQRVLIGVLRAVARAGVLALGAAALVMEAPPGVLAQLRLFGTWVAMPELVAAALAATCRARLRIEDTALVLEARHRRIDIERSAIGTFRPWRLPWPLPGFDVLLRSQRRWSHGIATRGAARLLRLLASEDEARQVPMRSRSLLEALDLAPRRIDAAWFKFALFPLLPALPAFRLHQLIAYGSAFGEYYTFGAKAYLSALLLWWASWAVSLVLVAGGLHLVVESGTALVLAVRPQRTRQVRHALLHAARIAYFAGVPAWLLLRLAG